MRSRYDICIAWKQKQCACVRLALTINFIRSLVDVSRACHQDDCSQCHQVAQGCEAVSTHIMKASTILEDKAS